MVAVRTEVLVCTPTDGRPQHTWERPFGARGRKPPQCPADRPAVVTNKTQTLHCVKGDHEWERPSQRGKLPVNCPNHVEAKPISTRQRSYSAPTGNVTDDGILEYRRTSTIAEERFQARRAAGDDRATRLIGMLREHGNDIQQHRS